jgi:hypothetical protein
VEKKVNVGGKEQTVRETQYRYALREVKEEYLLSDMKFYNARGAKLKPKDALKRLTPGTPFLLSADGEKVDPAYLRMIKDDTLILVPSK